ncbi:substrate-binding periplasmic protein [Bowmanella denitrificans]|uniref:substrate-binding periplasmic protein n=1 Tax=Bowmanella denitrificans TaxID=366582 RepID=UPI000C9A46A7|nr:transporter substrate-binding domain-containing protein [Bowmanella denitrificans]
MHHVLLVICLLLTSLAVIAEERVRIAVFDEHSEFLVTHTGYGLAWEILELAAEQADIVLLPQESSWTGALNRLHAGKVKMIFGVLKTKERQSWLQFSLPLGQDKIRVFTGPENIINQVEDIDFTTARVGVSAKSVSEQHARALGFKHIYAIRERGNLFQMLSSGRLDYLIFGEAFVGYFCKTAMANSSSCLKPLLPVLQHTDIRFAAPLDNPDAVALSHRIDQQIRLLATRPDIRQLFERYRYSEQDYQTWLDSLPVENR